MFKCLHDIEHIKPSMIETQTLMGTKRNERRTLNHLQRIKPHKKSHVSGTKLASASAKVIYWQ